MNNKYLTLTIIMGLAVCGCSEQSRLNAREIFKDKNVRSLAIAAAKGDTNKVDIILAQGTDVNSVGDEGVTPLAWALLKMNKIGFEHLLKRDADPNARMDDRNTILFYAAQYDDPFYLDTALKYGGNPNQRKKWLNIEDGKISLLWYTTTTVVPRPDMVRILVKHGADINEQRHGGGIVRSCASKNHYENVFILLEAGANFSTNREPSSLLERIENRAVHPDSPEYEWLEKVVQWLRDRNIEVTPKEWKQTDQPKIINVVTE